MYPLDLPFFRGIEIVTAASKIFLMFSSFTLEDKLLTNSVLFGVIGGAAAARKGKKKGSTSKLRFNLGRFNWLIG